MSFSEESRSGNLSYFYHLLKRPLLGSKAEFFDESSVALG